jgi:2-haloacid dehalogenase
MSTTIAFDVYGTLIDTHSLVSILQSMIGDKASSFSQTWRDKQLEYSFRRGLMQQYETFAVCTSNALDYTCEFYDFDLSTEQKKDLLKKYKTLPAFEDAKEGLSKLRSNNFRLFAFSNGTANAIDTLLLGAKIRDYFHGVVSVDDLESFKPNPAVYNHFLKVTDAKKHNTWLVSSNPFDVIGAISVGMRAAWVKRSKNAIFDPWGVEPTITVYNLDELNEKLTNKAFSY